MLTTIRLCSKWNVYSVQIFIHSTMNAITTKHFEVFFFVLSYFLFKFGFGSCIVFIVSIRMGKKAKKELKVQHTFKLSKNEMENGFYVLQVFRFFCCCCRFSLNRWWIWWSCSEECKKREERKNTWHQPNGITNNKQQIIQNSTKQMREW